MALRVLVTRRPISPRELKRGDDKYAYDAVKKVWLPGRVTPVSRPDLSLLRRVV